MKYPVFLNLESRRVVVIGAGVVATRKILGLLEAKARVVVVAEEIDDGLAAKFKDADIELIQSKYSKDYLAGATIAFAATNDEKLNEQIYKDCQQLEVLCNVVDCPELCDFFSPAVVRRDDLQIAICTEGSFPAYAGHLRKKLEEIITPLHGEFVGELEKLRGIVFEKISDIDKRKSVLGTLAGDEAFEIFKRNGPKAFGDWAEKIINEIKD
ncbi:MAG: bifunctional precorrin-2 dehydrogenase/sirohydrochlorin ferrochelatase [Sedimentisphaerales bacterium]|nr:bifunctional precorrin-2 dehydrogenase/sirohydrochlorin ferrochelatase [Sedimentisphaerales bacterium]